MDNRWDQKAADEFVARYDAQGVSKALALRVYSSRLIGQDPALVLHGGGNTSVKDYARDVTGERVAVLYVKGSGWDLASIEPPGFPAVRLEGILRLRGVKQISDEEMVNTLRTNLLNASAPNPSVEALLHGFLPHRFVDHTHADAILALVNQPDAEARCAETFKGKLAILPFVFPGFSLAGVARQAFEQDPTVEGIVLLNHGLFTMGESAEESYGRMIEYVTLAEQALANRRHPVFFRDPEIHDIPQERLLELSPAIRGSLAEADSAAPGGYWRYVLHFRTSREIRQFVDGTDLADYGLRGVATPDHIIRTKNQPLVLPTPQQLSAEEYQARCRDAVADYRATYHRYFAENAARTAGAFCELDGTPRVLLLPGGGLFAAGTSENAARIAADLFEHTIRIITQAEGSGRYTPLDEAALFEMEYWSLEQAKLGKIQEAPLSRQVVLLTGAASGIGLATARAFGAQGAHLVLLDRDPAQLNAVASELIAAKVNVCAITCDVTDPAAVEAAVQETVGRFGGLDVAISNAGGLWQGTLAECEAAVLRESFELNFFAHQTLAAAVTRVFIAQGTGGHLLFNASKSAFNPGPALGPYTLPKAALIALTKQYAVDYGNLGIRSNAVNADRVHTALFGDSVLETRAKMRGLSVERYLAGNLLRQEVRAEDVAAAFVQLALSERTTGAVLPVDGGNIAAAPR